MITLSRFPDKYRYIEYLTESQPTQLPCPAASIYSTLSGTTGLVQSRFRTWSWGLLGKATEC